MTCRGCAQRRKWIHDKVAGVWRLVTNTTKQETAYAPQEEAAPLRDQPNAAKTTPAGTASTTETAARAVDNTAGVTQPGNGERTGGSTDSATPVANAGSTAAD